MANNSNNKKSLISAKTATSATRIQIPTDSGCSAGETLCGYYDNGDGKTRNCCSRSGSCSHFKNTTVSTCVGTVCGIPDYKHSTCCQSPTVLCQGYCPNGMPYPEVQCIDPKQIGWCNPPLNWCIANGGGFTTSTTTTTQPPTTTISQTTRATTTLPLPTTTTRSTSTTTISPTTYVGSSTTTRATTSTTSTSSTTQPVTTAATSTTTVGPLKSCSFWGQGGPEYAPPVSVNIDVKYIACGLNTRVISRKDPSSTTGKYIAWSNSAFGNSTTPNTFNNLAGGIGPVAAGISHFHGINQNTGTINSWASTFPTGMGGTIDGALSLDMKVSDTTNMPYGNAKWNQWLGVSTYDDQSIAVQEYEGADSLFTWGTSVERAIPAEIRNGTYMVMGTTAGNGFYATTGSDFIRLSQNTVRFTSLGTIKIWGWHSEGTLSTATPGYHGIEIPDTTDNPNEEYTQVAGGRRHLAALKYGRVYVFVDRIEQEFNESRVLEVPSSALSGVVAIASGYNHILALKGDGTIVAWGNNTYGQCNIPTNNGNNKASTICAGGNTSGAIWKYTNNYNPANWAFPSTTTTRVATTTKAITTTTTIGQQEQ